MRKIIVTIIFAFFHPHLNAQPNCNIYKSDEKCFESCKEAIKAISYRQGSYKSQRHFDRSIELCPSFSYSYFQKAIPFLKRGKFLEWKKLIDIAVELSPEEYLGYRGWCRLQFLRDYEGAIKDIERLKSIVNYDIGYGQSGDYHLNIALALCYKKIGEVQKARELFQQHLTLQEDPYDYYHFGVLEYEEGNYETALKYFTKQISINDYLGETYYFMALCSKKLDEVDMYSEYIDKAESYYKNGKYRVDVYVEPLDKIYLSDIVKEKNMIR